MKKTEYCQKMEYLDTICKFDCKLFLTKFLHVCPKQEYTNYIDNKANNSNVLYG